MNTLFVVATPIGNLEDITLRAARVLLETPVIACEDTRHTGQLIKLLAENSKFQIPNSKQAQNSNVQFPKKFISVRDWNEVSVVEEILRELEFNDVVLVSDAGTPLLSDPGFKVVRAVRAAGYTVSPVPGAFAAAAALSAAGLPTNKFLFWGFLPKKWNLESEITHVIYESPIRTLETLNILQTRYPQAKIVVANEMTKIHEKIFEWHGEELKLKGEVVILVYFETNSKYQVLNSR